MRDYSLDEVLKHFTFLAKKDGKTTFSIQLDTKQKHAQTKNNLEGTWESKIYKSQIWDQKKNFLAAQQKKHIRTDRGKNNNLVHDMNF